MFQMLSPEQRGWLLTAIYAYAQQLSQEEAAVQAGELAIMEAVADSIPELEDQTRMAFSFVASSIYRDTLKWYAQRRSRTQRKSQKALSRPAQSNGDSTDSRGHGAHAQADEGGLPGGAGGELGERNRLTETLFSCMMVGQAGWTAALAGRKARR